MTTRETRGVNLNGQSRDSTDNNKYTTEKKTNKQEKKHKTENVIDEQHGPYGKTLGKSV